MTKTVYTQEHKRLVERLKQARAEAKLDQITAAVRLGVSQSYISKIESGQRRIDLVQIKQFAALYKKSVEFFIE